jgi:enoyl-CoA hydratase/carnithine racemase
LETPKRQTVKKNIATGIKLSKASFANMASNLSSPPPPTASFIISYPADHVMLVTINRPKAMNSLPSAAHWEGEKLFAWFDNDPWLRVAVITGAGEKSFSAGADLIEAGRMRATGVKPSGTAAHPYSGFMGVSRRVGKKPIIAAVNGFALGGGFEICLGWYVYYVDYSWIKD